MDYHAYACENCATTKIKYREGIPLTPEPPYSISIYKSIDILLQTFIYLNITFHCQDHFMDCSGRIKLKASMRHGTKIFMRKDMVTNNNDSLMTHLFTTKHT